MRRFLALMLLLVSLGWSFNIQEYIGPNESAKSVTYLDMVGPNGAYVMYYLNNEPIMLVQGDTIVTDKEIIVPVLQQYFFSKDFPKPAELQEIRARMISFNKSRENLYNDETVHEYFPPEDYCKQITGLKVRHCNENETMYHPCMTSCGAVPICRRSILEGGITSSDKTTYNFLDGILSLDKETIKLDTYADGVVNITTKLEGMRYSDYNADTLKELNTMLSYMEGVQSSETSIENNILFSDLLSSAGLQSYCGPVNYSKEDSRWLATTAQTIRARIQNLANVDSIADMVLNRTKEREKIKVQIKTQSEFGAKFDDMDKRYSYLYTRYVKVSKYLEDEGLANDINTLKAKKDSARDDIYRGNYNKADLTIKQFNVLADSFDQKLDGYFNITSQLEEYKTAADKKIILAQWDIEINNIILSQQLQDVKIRKETLDSKLAAKIKPEELENITQQYGQIVDEIDEIIQAKREHTLDTVLNKVVMAANAYSDIVASAYVSMSSGDYQQKKQAHEVILPATLVMVDLVAISAFIAAFIYMVGSGRIRLRKISAMLWSFIFIAFFLSLIGASAASYILLDKKTNNASFDAFYYEMNASNATAIIIDTTNGVVSDACAKSLKNTLELQNKTVYIYNYDIGGCTLKDYTKGAESGNMTTGMSVEACEEKMGAMPRIFIKNADADSTTFSVKYYPSATIAGRPEYMQQCLLDVILAESQ